MAFRVFKSWADRRMRRQTGYLIELCTVYIYQRAFNLFKAEHEGKSDAERLAVCVTKHLLGGEPTDSDMRVFYRKERKKISAAAERAMEADPEIRSYAGFILRVQGVLEGPPNGHEKLEQADRLDPTGRVPSGKRIQAILRPKNLKALAKKIQAEKERD